jgi:hypothetical protein
MTLVSIRLSIAHAAWLLLPVVATVGCSQRLTESNVREFIDHADQAFLKGRTHDVCNLRAATFTLTSTDLDLTGQHPVADQKEAEALAAQREANGERLSADVHSLDRQQFCLMAIEAGHFYERATMQRSALDIRVAPDGRRAVVRAHYTVREPILEAGDSAIGYKDQVEHQIGSRQTESDDESVIVLDDNEILFASTRANSRSFRIASERDSRL